MSLRAGLVEKAQQWPWSSLAARQREAAEARVILDPWLVRRPADWVTRVNRPQDEKELAALRRCRDRGRPFGDEGWVQQTAERLHLESSLRPVGRPPVAKETDGKDENGFDPNGTKTSESLGQTAAYACGGSRPLCGGRSAHH